MSENIFDGLTGLVRLIYASRWTVEDGPALNEMVRSILVKSIANNRAVNVTGLLLVHDGWFVQALEGPVDGVKSTYERVCRDDRHKDVVLLDLSPAQMRAFRDWNMTERRLTALQGPLLERFGQKGDFNPAALTGEQAMTILSSVGAAYVA